MTLMGAKGDTGERKLDTSANNFERGAVRAPGVWKACGSGPDPGHGWVPWLDFVAGPLPLPRSCCSCLSSTPLILCQLTPRPRLPVPCINPSMHPSHPLSSCAHHVRPTPRPRLPDCAHARYQVDTFMFEAPDIGEFNMLRIAHDDSGFGSAWHLQKVGQCCG